MNNGSSNYGGYVGGRSVYSTGNSILTLGTNVSEVKREALRLMFDVTKSVNLIGLNNTAPAHTLDIINAKSSVNALNIKNAAGTTTLLTLADNGLLSLTGNVTISDNNLSVVTTSANYINNNYLICLYFDMSFTNDSINNS